MERERDRSHSTGHVGKRILNSRSTTSQKSEAVQRRARIQGSKTHVPLNSRLESNQAEEEENDGAGVPLLH